ncbi:S6 family peptidase [Enterobacter asburiae]|uniref:S6 family peptidase n=1 Tax=Enterobacter asburiae TaxID=61645 RepID=UPI0021CB8AFD|nr:S6 family peptidase [Enterobacter asburiae]
MCFTAIHSTNAFAGLMSDKFTVQEFRDFAENLGRYTPGMTGISIPEKDAMTSHTLNFPMPDFGSVISGGYATLYSPSYLASVKHNSGYKSVDFGNSAKYKTTYVLINRNEDSSQDFHLPRLNKVVTEAAALPQVVTGSDLKAHPERYVYYARAGAGTQVQLDAETGAEQNLTGAYNWKTGGTFNKVVFENARLRWYMHGPDDPNVAPLEIGGKGGDSGSPVLVYDNVDNVWKLAGVTTAIGDSGYNQRTYALFLQSDFAQAVIAANTSPDVKDSDGEGDIHWTQEVITQGNHRWGWTGLADRYKNLAPSQASYEELDSTRDLRFSGDGGSLILDDAINMGAGKLQFSANYVVQPGRDPAATWAGGGIEVDERRTVYWGVNGVANDALHKIGKGTLWVNAVGDNPGSLNVGDGTVVLDQQADDAGHKQAFSSVTLVSGRPTVVLSDAGQLSTDNIFFGYRGGTLDLNGNNLGFREINHTDSGAALVNRNSTVASTVMLTGYSPDDIALNRWSSTRKGNPGDLYLYNNPYNHKTEYFRLKTESYGYFPTSQTSNSSWEYMGNDRDQAALAITTERNRLVFRGFLGERDSAKAQGKLNITLAMPDVSSVMALTGGANVTGAMDVKSGTLLLSGQPVPHAGGVVYDDDWQTASFRADTIDVRSGAVLQVGTWTQVYADIKAADGAQVLLGYHDAQDGGTPLWRCAEVINTDTGRCSQEPLSQEVADALPESTVEGDITLGSGAHLQLGKVVWQGSLAGQAQSSMSLASTSLWRMTDSSVVDTLVAAPGSRISTLPLQDNTWHAKTLTVDALHATGTLLNLGLNISAGTGDKVVITSEATGQGNMLNIVPLAEDGTLLPPKQGAVFADAPGGTDHNYFTLASLSRGFTLYTPDYQVKDENNRVLWVLERKQNNDPVTPVETPTAPDVSAAPEETPDAPDIPAVSEEKPVTSAEPVILEEKPATSQTDTEDSTDEQTYKTEDVKPGSINDWFTIEDNRPLIHHTRALMASRQYLVSEAVSQLYNRTNVLHNAPEDAGSWVTLEQRKGNFLGLDASQQTLALGWDRHDGIQGGGIGVSYTQGKIKGAGDESHRMATAGAYYTRGWGKGGFVDVSGQYMHLLQDITLDPLTGIQGQKRNSHILTGGVRTGYQFGFFSDALQLKPFAGVSTAHLSGYSLQGDNADVRLSSATPYYASAGLQLQKRGFGKSLENINLTASMEYLYSPGKNGSQTTLADRQSVRHYASWSDNRYRVKVGLDGDISQDVMVSAKGETSFGGVFRTDYSGSVNLIYRFR